MKAKILYDDFAHPPILRMFLHGCPHKRQIREVLQRFREDLLLAAQRQIGEQIELPIDHPIDLEVFCQNPASPDLDHLLEAVYMALDGKSLKGPSILTDDRLISKVTISKFYNTDATRRDTER